MIEIGPNLALAIAGVAACAVISFLFWIASRG